MTEPKNRSHEINTENHDFQTQIDAITNRDLTPESIGSYGDDALTDLIAVVDKITTSYAYNPTVSQGLGVDSERAALRYAGLDPEYVEVTLDHIADTAANIKRVAMIAEQLTGNGMNVITPPNEAPSSITIGNGSFEAKKIIPRLQTTLLVIEQNFGINIDPQTSSPEEFRFIPGTVSDTMMRQTPYGIIDLPRLNRVIDICDEEGNRTFVFDRSKLLGSGITLEALKHMTKDELKELLANGEAFGRDLIYTTRFVENLVGLINEIPSNEKSIAVNPDAAKLLKPEYGYAPEGYLSVFGIAKMSGWQNRTVGRAVTALTDELGEVRKYRFGSQSTNGYSPLQIEKILDYLGRRAPDAPEGYLSASGIAHMYNISDGTVARALSRLDSAIGETSKYRFHTKVTTGYSLGQVQQILGEIGEISPDAPEGYMSASGISKVMRVTEEIVNRAIEELQGTIGETNKYKFHSRTVTGYSPEQIKMVIEHVGELAPDAPDGYLSAYGIALKIGRTHGFISRAIAQMGNILGEVREYRFTIRKAEGYSPTQIQMILDYVGHTPTEPPEGFLPISSAAELYGTTSYTIKKAIDELGNELGEVNEYMFGTRQTAGYSPEQLRIVLEHIHKNTKAKLGKKALEIITAA